VKLTALPSPPGFDIPTITVQENGTYGDKAKPLAAYRRRLCCLAASYITALAPGVKREAEEDWGRGFLYAVRGTHRRSKD